jgi:hypothetical protein
MLSIQKSVNQNKRRGISAGKAKHITQQFQLILTVAVCYFTLPPAYQPTNITVTRYDVRQRNKDEEEFTVMSVFWLATCCL